jgi:hypothetical protein
MIYSVIVDTWYDTRYHVEYMGQRKVVFHTETVPSAVLEFIKNRNHRSEALNECATIYYKKGMA